MKDRIIRVDITMHDCVGICGEGAERSLRVFQVFRELGCRFFNMLPKYPLERFPISDTSGDILPNAGLFHPLLASSARALEGASEGDGTFSFSQELLLFSLGQNIRTDDLDSMDNLAYKQIEFFKKIINAFRPQFSTIDEFGENVGVPESVIAKRTLTRLFWYNVFGPTYCDRYGKEAFLHAPAWRAEDLGEHGVSVTASEKFSTWLKKPSGDLVKYFTDLFPGIKPFRARRS